MKGQVMNDRQRSRLKLLWILAIGLPASLPSSLLAAEENPLLPLLQSELKLSMEKLVSSEGTKPYFIQYAVDDSIFFQMSAKYGDIVESRRDRSRDFFSKVRVGSYELDNTNFSGDGGGFFFFGGSGGVGRARLPIEENYTAIRQAIWRATDKDYKDGVETLTRKRAYMNG